MTKAEEGVDNMVTRIILEKEETHLLIVIFHETETERSKRQWLYANY